MHHFVEFDAINTETQIVERQFFGTTGRMSKPGEFEEPVYHAPHVDEALTFLRSMYNGSVIGGASVPGYGQITLFNTDGRLDYLKNMGVGLRNVTVKIGSDRWAYDELETQFSGVMERLYFAENKVIIEVKDYQRLLDKDLPLPKYMGTGAMEGGIELTGQYKPLLFGFCYDIEPVYLGVINGLHTYQYHHGKSAAYDGSQAVFDGGNEYVYTSGNPTGSQWTMDETQSLIKVAQLPAQILTANMKGDAITGGNVDGYVSSVPQCMQRLLETLTDITLLDQASIDALHTLQPAEVGVFRRDGATALDILDSLANNIGAYWGFNRSAEFECGRFDAVPDDATSDVWLTKAEIFDIEKVEFQDPVFNIALGYQRRWTEVTNILPSASQDKKDFLATEFRTIEREDADNKVIWPNSDPFIRNTNLINEIEANDEAARLQTLLGTQRDLFRIRARHIPELTDLNQLVGIKYHRFDLEAGKIGRVIQISDESKSLAELLVWL